MSRAELLQLAERVRAALITQAQAACEDAAIRGLCAEGAVEVAVSAMRSMDVAPLLTGNDVGAADPWPWPASLDALSAAPDHHTLLLENVQLRVLETRIPAGETVPVHTHRWPSVLYVLGWSDFVRRGADGTVLLDTRAAGSAPPPDVLWSEALPPHALENVGTSEIRVVSVEIKSGEASCPSW